MVDKKILLKYCTDLLLHKVDELKQQQKELQISANDNSKSSMGDKYETGRAMIHLEQENLVTRYQVLESQLQVLNGLKINLMTKAFPGALVSTTAGNFYLSIGLGKIDINDTTVFAIASNSPIGMAITGKEVNDTYEVNGKQFTILSII